MYIPVDVSVTVVSDAITVFVKLIGIVRVWAVIARIPDIICASTATTCAYTSLLARAPNSASDKESPVPDPNLQTLPVRAVL
jgi:hypothetical protein